MILNLPIKKCRLIYSRRPPLYFPLGKIPNFTDAGASPPIVWLSIDRVIRDAIQRILQASLRLQALLQVSPKERLIRIPPSYHIYPFNNLQPIFRETAITPHFNKGRLIPWASRLATLGGRALAAIGWVRRFSIWLF
jgi:hypothetical protein